MPVIEPPYIIRYNTDCDGLVRLGNRSLRGHLLKTSTYAQMKEYVQNCHRYFRPVLPYIIITKSKGKGEYYIKGYSQYNTNTIEDVKNKLETNENENILPNSKTWLFAFV